jgi:hypothetical protein
MRPCAPSGFLSDCSLSEDHPGRIVPPRAILQTVSSVVREQGAVSSFFPPRLLAPSNASMIRELRSFSSFAGQMRSVNEKLIAAHAFMRSQQDHESEADSAFSSSSSSGKVLAPDDAEAILSNFGFFEETPLVVVNTPTTAEVKKFGASVADHQQHRGASSSIQNQRSDFAKLLEDSLNNTSSPKNAAATDPSSLIPSFPEVSMMIGIHSEFRRKAAEAFVERCKQLWQMFQALNNPNNTEIPEHVAKQLMTASTTSSSNDQKKNYFSRAQLLKQPLVFSLQVALCAQDIACSPYVGHSWDLLGGSIKEVSNFSGPNKAKNGEDNNNSNTSTTTISSSRRRIQLRDVFPTEEEARKQMEIAVLIHKILVAICNPPPSPTSPSTVQPSSIELKVDPADLAILAYFALPRSDGGDGTRLLELWPGGPLALFPIASFASFVPIREAATAKIDLCANARLEDGADPVLRIRCSSMTNSQTLLQQLLEQQQQQQGSAATDGKEGNASDQVLLRIWKRPISSTVPENVVAAKETAMRKDPRMAIARFMQNVMKPTSSNEAGIHLTAEQKAAEAEKRQAALEMAMRLAGQN